MMCCATWLQAQPRMRIIIDNDFSGDPDGLFQLVHHVLSPSVDIRGIIGSHLGKGAGFDEGESSARNACKKTHEVLQLMGADTLRVAEGAAHAMSNASTPIPSEGSRLIIDEAMRSDTSTPLYILCGAGLTNIASAYLQNPEIAHRLTLIWIGGQEYDELPPPNYSMPEYNLNLSIAAAQTIFNLSDIPLWQVPRYAYRQCIYSMAEMETKIKPCGKIGNYLYTSIANLMQDMKRWGNNLGEVYILGDSPLVLLTALQTGFEPDPASSHYVIRQSPTIAPDGSYHYNPNGRSIRVYTRLDTRLLFADMEEKLKLTKK